MPKDKLNTQWSDDWHREASNYTSDQQSTYKRQAQPGNRPSGNRAKPDYANQSEPEDYKAYVKPASPDCDGLQFARNPYDNDNYLSVARDAWDNERPTDRMMHNEPQMGDKGSFGGRQYAEFQKNAQDTYGYQIAYSPNNYAGMPNASTVYVDLSRADRGADYVENTSDSGRTGPSSPYSDNNNVARGNMPPTMRNRGR